MASIIGSTIGLLISIPYASAWGFHTGTAPDWILALRPVISPFQSFAELPDIYNFYAHFFIISSIGHLAGIHGIYLIKRSSKKNRNVLEKRGIALSYSGVALSTVGVFTDGWTGGPPGFFAVIIATPIIGVGVTMLSIYFRKIRILSRFQMAVILACGVCSLPFSLLLFQHTPTGQLFLLHIVWIILGWKLYKGLDVREKQGFYFNKT